jgi:hypothetical protein
MVQLGAIKEGAILEGAESSRETIAASILERGLHIVQAFEIRDRFSHVEIFNSPRSGLRS